MPASSVTKRRRQGQAAVETMIMAFTIAVILVSMFHLFTVTWATQNAHIRAREAVLHDTTNLDAGRLGYTTPQSSPWSNADNNYEIADPSNVIFWTAGANDTTRDDLIGPQDVRVTWTITE